MSSSEASGAKTVLGGRYRLLRRLGSGGMATVWMARDERLGRDVAVKVLSDVLAGDERYARRFEREARVAAGLNHPGLVPVLDFGAESGRPYLVMELVRGDTLARRIAAGTTRELDLVALARDLLGAVGHIHAGGVVHRDVKPANVLIGPDGRARLTDFGIARHEDASTLTQAGQVVGTLAYMAPEIQRGDPATPRSDLYSLGVLLRACGGDREPSLVPLIERLSARDPAGRPASAAQALTILGNTGATPAEPGSDATQPLAATEPTAVLTSGSPRQARAGRARPKAQRAVARSHGRGAQRGRYRANRFPRLPRQWRRIPACNHTARPDDAAAQRDRRPSSRRRLPETLNPTRARRARYRLLCDRAAEEDARAGQEGR